jgi:hypothetical protein
VKEIWKPVTAKKYSKYYLVSNLGRVMALQRIVRYVNPRSGSLVSRPSRKRIMKAQKDSNGYLRVPLSLNNKVKVFSVHRLVALALIARPHGKKCVNHKNFICHVNRTGNLEWTTYSGNNRYSVDRGRYHKNGKHKNSKLTLSQVRKVKEMTAQGISQCAIARKFKASKQNIYRIQNNKTWKHVK